MKKLVVKQVNKKALPEKAKVVQKVEEDVLGDIWETAEVKSKNYERFRNFVDKTTTKVKAVVVPMSG